MLSCTTILVYVTCLFLTLSFTLLISSLGSIRGFIYTQFCRFRNQFFFLNRNVFFLKDFILLLGQKCWPGEIRREFDTHSFTNVRTMFVICFIIIIYYYYVLFKRKSYREEMFCHSLCLPYTYTISIVCGTVWTEWYTTRTCHRKRHRLKIIKGSVVKGSG